MPYLVAVITGTVLSCLLLVARYAPRTGSFLCKDFYYFGYGLLSGLLAALALAVIGTSANQGPVDIPSIEIPNPYIRAVALGLLVGSVRHKLPEIANFTLTLTIGEKSHSLIRIVDAITVIDRWLLANMLLRYEIAVEKYVEERASIYTDASEVESMIQASSLSVLDLLESAAYTADLKDKEFTPSATVAMNRFVKQFGKDQFDRAFPEPRESVTPHQQRVRDELSSED